MAAPSEIDDRLPAAEGAGANTRLLLVEDDQETADEIISALSRPDCALTHVVDGPAGLARAGSGGFDIIIMDRMLPGLDGLAVLSALRQAEISTPVILMSALGDVDERVRGLKAGGDDYLAKPFAMVELAARIEALLRRPALSRGTSLQVGPLELDLIARKVSRAGRDIELLPREFKLLEYFMRRPGQVLTRAMLLENVWNYRFLTETNLVDVHVGKLRKKIDASGEAPMIHSVRGAGFMLIAGEE